MKRTSMVSCVSCTVQGLVFILYTVVKIELIMCTHVCCEVSNVNATWG